jgi:hypothetical protein
VLEVDREQRVDEHQDSHDPAVSFSHWSEGTQ